MEAGNSTSELGIPTLEAKTQGGEVISPHDCIMTCARAIAHIPSFNHSASPLLTIFHPLPPAALTAVNHGAHASQAGSATSGHGARPKHMWVAVSGMLVLDTRHSSVAILTRLASLLSTGILAHVDHGEWMRKV